MKIDDGAVLILQVGQGAAARAVPDATSKIGTPLKLPAVLEEQATEALAPERTAPFNELAARLKGWMAQADALTKTDVGSDRFYRDLLDMSERMDEIYGMSLSLPDPMVLLFEERGVRFYRRDAANAF